MQKRSQSSLDLRVNEGHLTVGGEKIRYLPKALAWGGRKSGQALQPGRSMPETLVKDDVVNADRVKLLRVRLEMVHAVADGLVDDFVVIELVRNGRVIALQEVLIDPKLGVKDFLRNLQATSDTVERVLVQALVVDALNLNDNAQIS